MRVVYISPPQTFQGLQMVMGTVVRVLKEKYLSLAYSGYTTGVDWSLIPVDISLVLDFVRLVEREPLKIKPLYLFSSLSYSVLFFMLLLRHLRS